MELRKAIEHFLSEQRSTTAESYRYVLWQMRDFIGPARPVNAIKPVQLVEYIQSLKAKNYAAATELKIVKTIKVFFNWLVKMEAIEKSPARVLKQRKLPTYVKRDKAMSDKELAKILWEVQNNPCHRAVILFLADTGCRAGGAAGLTLENLDIKGREAQVTEKGDKTRAVTFGDTCALALLEWLLRRPKAAGIYVFSRNQKAVNADSISQIVRRACKAAGVRSLGSHSLRHRKGHQLADTRVAPSVAATALGHSDPTITLKHYYPADWESARQELQKLSVPADFSPKQPSRLLRIAGGNVILEDDNQS